jgi:hypothetical protein
MKRIVLAVSLLPILSCARQESAELAQHDSVLTKPQVTKVDTVRPTYNATGLVIDSLHATPKDREALLARFQPKEILRIYHDYRPLRNASVTPAQIEHFLTQNRITEAELKAILSEGDRLGWSHTP